MPGSPAFALAVAGPRALAVPRRLADAVRRPCRTAAAGFLRRGPIRGRRRGGGRPTRSSIRLTFLEPRAWVLVLPARPPVAAAFFAGAFHVPGRPLRLLGCIPQTPAGEPPQHGIRTLPLQLVQRRQQLFSVARPERGWLAVDQNGPVRITRRHEYILAGSAVADGRFPRMPGLRLLIRFAGRGRRFARSAVP